MCEFLGGFTSLLNSCSCAWTPFLSPSLMHWMIPSRSTSMLPVHTRRGRNNHLAKLKLQDIMLWREAQRFFITVVNKNVCLWVHIKEEKHSYCLSMLFFGWLKLDLPLKHDSFPNLEDLCKQRKWNYRFQFKLHLLAPTLHSSLNQTVQTSAKCCHSLPQGAPNVRMLRTQCSPFEFA